MTFSIPRSFVAALGLAMVCAVGGCASAEKDLKPNPEGLLNGTAWKLGKLGDQGALETSQPTLEFTEPGKVAGSGSCNRFTGTVTLAGATISFGPLAATKMACEAPINAQEAQYFKALAAAQRYVISGNSLQIYTKVMDLPLLFIRTKP